jgi:hypothetical protein
MIPWFRKGKYGWLLVVLIILVWDLAAAEEQTLSESFRRGWRHNPVAMVAIAAAWGMLTAHLYEALPQKADPLHLIYVVRVKTRGERHAVAA